MLNPQINSQKTYKTRSGLEVSQERFAEIVSLYLDSAASKEELKLLAELIQSDPRALAVFKQACRLHLATCRMFGKATVKLQPLPIVSHARRASRKAAVEWSLVAVFMIVCVVLFRLSQAHIADSEFEAVAQDFADIPEFDSGALSVSDSYVTTRDSCSIIYITE